MIKLMTSTMVALSIRIQQHLLGSKMILFDTLSRRPNHCPNIDDNNDDVIVLPDDLFLNLLNLDLQQCIASTNDLDIDVSDAIKTLLASNSTTPFHDTTDWTLEQIEGQNLLFFKGKTYVPKDLTLQQDIVRMFHNHETAGHPGEIQMYNTIRQHYWWPRM
jgi:hypothetical protein